MLKEAHLFSIHTRYGRVGSKGCSKNVLCGGRKDACKQYYDLKKKKCKASKYSEIPMKMGSKKEEDKSDIDHEESKLDPKVQNLMRFITDKK